MVWLADLLARPLKCFVAPFVTFFLTFALGSQSRQREDYNLTVSFPVRMFGIDRNKLPSRRTPSQVRRSYFTARFGVEILVIGHRRRSPL